MFRRFPQYLTEPYQILFMEPDDIAIGTSLFACTMMFSIWFFIPMILITYWYMKIKKKYPRGFFRHMLYCGGLVSITGYPTFFEEEFSE